MTASNNNNNKGARMDFPPSFIPRDGWDAALPRGPKMPQPPAGSQAFPAGRKHRPDPPEAEGKVKAAAPPSDTVAKSPGRDACGGAAPPPGGAPRVSAQGSAAARLRGQRVAAPKRQRVRSGRPVIQQPRGESHGSGACPSPMAGPSPSLGSESEEGSETRGCSPAASPYVGEPRPR